MSEATHAFAMTGAWSVFFAFDVIMIAACTKKWPAFMWTVGACYALMRIVLNVATLVRLLP